MRAISERTRPGRRKRKYNFMNARLNTQQQQQQQQSNIEKFTDRLSPEDLEAEIKRRLKKAEKIQTQLNSIQEITGDFETATLASKQTSNLLSQRNTTNPRLRGSTKSHVGSPGVGPYTRRPRDPINLRDKRKNDPPRKINVATFVPAPTQPGRLRQGMGPTPTGRLKQQTARVASPALPGRTASQFKVGRSASPVDIQERLKKKSPWFASILNPLANGGVKIPDPVGTDTGTYQHVENVTVPVNHFGVSGLRVVSPYINTSEVTNFPYNGANYQITNDNAAPNGSSILNLQWGDGLSPNNCIPFARIPEMMKSVAQSHRVVSAWVVAQPEISTLGDAGEMCAFVTPFDCNLASVAYTKYQAQWDSSLMPINQHKPLKACHYPLSSQFELFNGQEPLVNTTDTPQTISYQDFIDPNNDGVAAPGCIPWEFGVVCTGMTPSVGVVRFQIAVNYEFIPKTTTGMIAVSEDVADITQSNLVNSWVSDCPVTGVIPQSEASKPPSACSIPEEPSGFGMMFNVIEEMLPLIGKGAAMFL